MVSCVVLCWSMWMCDCVTGEEWPLLFKTVWHSIVFRFHTTGKSWRPKGRHTLVWNIFTIRCVLQILNISEYILFCSSPLVLHACIAVDQNLEIDEYFMKPLPSQSTAVCDPRYDDSTASPRCWELRQHVRLYTAPQPLLPPDQTISKKLKKVFP